MLTKRTMRLLRYSQTFPIRNMVRPSGPASISRRLIYGRAPSTSVASPRIRTTRIVRQSSAKRRIPTRRAGWEEAPTFPSDCSPNLLEAQATKEGANVTNLDNIGQTFQWAGQRYMAIMQPFAEKIFLGLVLIEIIINCVNFLADQDEPTRLLAELLKKSLALGFLYAMIVNAPIWFSAIIQGFQQIGGQAAGVPGLSPSSTFN